jgi:transcriptional regulator with XRE-family HTH domain
MSTPSSFDVWLKLARLDRHITQRELADRIGCSHRLIEKLEQGSRRPSKVVAELLADYFGIPAEGRSRLKELLEHQAGKEPTAARAKALVAAGSLEMLFGEPGVAQRLFEESAEIWRCLNMQVEYCRATMGCAQAAGRQGKFAKSEELYAQSFEMARELRDLNLVALGLMGRAEAMVSQRKFEDAEPLLEESLPLLQSSANDWARALALANLAEMALGRGNTGRALKLFLDSLALARQLNTKETIIMCLHGMAAVLAAEHDYRQAARLLGAAQALHTSLGQGILPPSLLPGRTLIEQTCEALGEADWQQAFDQGRQASLDDLIST